MDKVLLNEQLRDDIYYFNTGNHQQAYHFMGSQPLASGGFRFTVWAPHAHQVYLTGDFNFWALEAMERLDGGVWAIEISQALEGQCYKYGIDHGNGHIEYKMDPYGFQFEIAPKDASIVATLPDYQWSDQAWLRKRKTTNKYKAPLNIYEVHASSWRQHPDGSYYNLRELADSLIPYVLEMGYSHIELMPLMDHPLEASWGYQITGYYAICGRFGTMDQLKYFVDQAHQAGIGVILDWVPGHFCRNAYALAYFDGTPTYEYQDVNRANNIGWGTLNFDLGKTQVQSFLISNALFWLKEFHVDGIRVDAVSNMLYLDFDQGPWTPNEEGTNINLQGIQFLRKLNQTVNEIYPDVIMIAEESTSRLGITGDLSEPANLGFDFKWNLGWMHDTLEFFQIPPYARPQHLRKMTFVYMYQYDERFILPFSHDEVVHGKKSLLGRMPGERFEQFSNLRTLQAYMAAQPGKTLNFMGNELGQYLEWRYYEELDWPGLQREFNLEYQTFLKDLNTFYRQNKAFYELDHFPEGLNVLEADNLEDGYLTFIRQGDKPRDFVIVLCNFENKVQDLKVGVPYKGLYQLSLNSDAKVYGGAGLEVEDSYRSQAIPVDGLDHAIQVKMPALSVLFIQPKRIYGLKK